MSNNHPLGYCMTRRMFDSIVAMGSKKDNPYVAVMKYLNEQNGLRGTVRSISIKED